LAVGQEQDEAVAFCAFDCMASGFRFGSVFDEEDRLVGGFPEEFEQMGCVFCVAIGVAVGEEILDSNCINGCLKGGIIEELCPVLRNDQGPGIQVARMAGDSAHPCDHVITEQAKLSGRVPSRAPDNTVAEAMAPATAHRMFRVRTTSGFLTENARPGKCNLPSR
jgi:hypothetical protein